MKIWPDLVMSQLLRRSLLLRKFVVLICDAEGNAEGHPVKSFRSLRQKEIV